MLQNSVQTEYPIPDSGCCAVRIARYELSTALYWRMYAMWAMKLCLWVNGYRCFDRTRCLRLKVSRRPTCKFPDLKLIPDRKPRAPFTSNLSTFPNLRSNARSSLFPAISPTLRNEIN